MRKYKMPPRAKRKKYNKKYSSDTILKLIIDAELRPYGKTLEDIREIPEWFRIYKFTTKEQDLVWREYCNKLIRNHYYWSYISKAEADRLLCMVYLNYGLMAEYYDERFKV